ncbi:MAG: phosphatase PAP2 family protein [Gordonia sp. (in: high G+C Gram-positive bacteria)]
MRHPSRRRLITALAIPLVAMIGLSVPAHVAAAPASCAFTPAAVGHQSGFTPAQQAAPFATPAPANHIGLLDGFSTLSAAVKQQNLAEAIAINNTASPADIKYAVNDNYAVEDSSIFNALGSRLAPAFYAALGAGQLPKVSQLLFGDNSIIGSRYSTSAEKKYFNYKRPFEVAPSLIRHYGDGRADLYKSVAGNGSFPSGHTTWGYTQAFIIASLLPELGPQLLARASDYGNHRIVLGVHYPLDVIGGRITSEAVVSEALADPRFAGLVAQARTELRSVLAARVGAPIARIVACQQQYVSTTNALATYRQRATYGFLPTGAATPIHVPAGAENLIRAAHPGWSTAQLRALLARTALPGGYPLDKSGPQGGWQRLDIARAWTAR